jgi:hypothetical protein
MATTDAPPPFPDCWTAYGATDVELAAYGTSPRLLSGLAWAIVVAQLAAAVALAAIVLSPGPAALRLVAALACAAGLASAAVGLLRLLATARAVTFGREHVRLTRALGPAENVPWEQIGEIALVLMPRRAAVGLRLRPGASVRLTAPGRAAQRRITSDVDYLLFPADDDSELLGRVLLRYCIDREARQRLG